MAIMNEDKNNIGYVVAFDDVTKPVSAQRLLPGEMSQDGLLMK